MSELKSIKNWSEDDRPREKMMQKGAAALTDAELMAILISSGTKEHSALDLARKVLALAGNNLRELGRLSTAELQKIKGIGDARAITISAAMELGRRRQAGDGPERDSINKSADSARILMPMLQDLNHEAFCVLYLNTTCKVLRTEVVSSGGIAGTVVDIRMILKNSLLYNANKLVVGHNHPSGSRVISEADKRLTYKLVESAKLMDIQVLDHIIIAGNGYVSLADEGLI